MPDRTGLPKTGPTGPFPASAPVWPMVVIGCAGLLGAAGVTIAAAGSHTGGGDLARTASDFLMIHGGVILGAGVLGLTRPPCSVLLGIATGLLTVGTVLFSGELALAGLAGWRPLPLAAPTGGLCLILGWLLLGVFGVAAARSNTLAGRRTGL